MSGKQQREMASIWIRLGSRQAIERLAGEFGGFHDACLREISVATETFVGPNRAMSCPAHLDTSVLLFLQSQAARVPAIEIRCLQVARLSLRSSPDGCDSILAAGAVGMNDGWLRLALNFLGAPLEGPPNSTVRVPPRGFDDPDIDVIAREIDWRPVENGLGSALRYRPADLTTSHGRAS